jgi:hypothetical protein
MCSIDPPALSSKVIRNLGEQFCMVAPGELAEKALNKRKVSNKVVQPPA